MPIKKKNIIVVAVLLAAASLVSVSFAALLGIFPEFPRISFDNGDTVYDAGTNVLSIQAFPSVIELSPSGPPLFINPTGISPSEGVTIGVTVDDTGALVGGVTDHDLIVEGEVDLDGDSVVDYAGVLLTGEVSGFGFRNNMGTSTDEYDFRFTLTGGALAFLYLGKDLGVTVTSESSDFAADFSVGFAGKAKGILGGIPGTASLGDFVWEDLDADGIQDVDEVGIEDVTVNLYWCGPDGIAGTADDTLLATTQTDASGEYLFDGLAPGQYYVEFVAPSGFTFSPKDQGSDDSVDSDADSTTGKTVCTTLDTGDSDLTLDAGLYRPASLGDFVWNDTNRNGIQDDGEPGIADVTVKLYDCKNVLKATTTTNAGGLYLFDNLAPGNYYVKFTAPSGYVFSPRDQGGDDTKDSDADPLTGLTICTALESGENDLTWDAGLYIPATAEIGDFVWIDANANGIQDALEPGIADVTVKLYDCKDVLKATTTTNASGLYLFENLEPGDYYVKFLLPSGYVFTLPDQGSDDDLDSDADPITGRTICTNIEAGESDRTWDAGVIYQCVLEVIKTCFVKPPPPSGNDCEGKVISMVLNYTGQGCEATNHTQDPRKVKCTGDANDAEPVNILVTNKRKDKVYADVQGVLLNGTVFVDAGNAGRDNLDAETLVRVFNNQGVLIEEVKFHTSCSQPLNLEDQFGSFKLTELTTTEGGTVTIPEPQPPEPSSDCTIQAAPPPPHCEGKVKVLSLRYLGGDCSETTNTQEGKFQCNGDTGSTEPVRIIATNNKESKIYLDTGAPASVNIDDVVDIAASNAGRNELEADTKLTVFDGNGNVLQTLKIHTSCSKPLNLGDRFGSLEVAGMDTTEGGSITPGTEVEFTYEITNTGTGVVTNVSVIDDVLGEIPGSPIPSIAPGETATLTKKALLDETTTNTVTVTGNPGPFECVAEASSTITVEEPPPAPIECTTRVKAMLLLYTGPELLGAEVKIFADKFSSEPVIYSNVDLIPNVTFLMSPAQNDWTIDATAQGQSELGAKTKIYINGIEEVLHTSCSTPFVVMKPAPLDNPKGDPSPNWFVWDFIQK